MFIKKYIYIDNNTCKTCHLRNSEPVNRFVGYKVNSYLPSSTDSLAGFTVPYQVGRGDSHDDQTVATVSEKSNRNNQWSRVLADVATAHVTLIKHDSEGGKRQSPGQSAELSAQC